MKTNYRYTTLILLVCLPIFSLSQIALTKHNLSAGSGNTIKASTENEVCIFCHTPHNSTTAQPLWNRSAPTTTYTLYTSSTLNATLGQPDGTSAMCLSCHDGLVALGNVVSRSTPISFGASSTIPAGNTNLSTNLSDDHPISFVYSSALAATAGQLKDPTAITHPVNLDKNNKMQCTSCHDAHDNSNGKFLLRTTQGSALCFSCHDRDYWSTSSHSTSTKTWNSSGTNPWPHSSYTTVAQNACESCHQPHTAGGASRILNYQNEEENCMNCHNGNVAAKDVKADFLKTYRHNIYNYNATHDPTEPASVTSTHVECQDCHNPHATNSNTATAPNIKGSMAGVRGVDINGAEVNPASFEYEVCFRCHADNRAMPRYITRYRGIGNTRYDFTSTNVSYHPVAAVGKNTSMTTLASPYTASSQIYCSSCHASDNNSNSGPHGSSNVGLLKNTYDTTKAPYFGAGWNSTTLYNHYTLCFECHTLSTTTTMHTNIAGGHFFKYIGCSTCHDPHGYDGSLGTNGGNTASAFEMLVNFDTTIIRPNANNGKLIDIPNRKCYMVCHEPNGTGTMYHVHLDNGSGF